MCEADTITMYMYSQALHKAKLNLDSALPMPLHCFNCEVTDAGIFALINALKILRMQGLDHPLWLESPGSFEMSHCKMSCIVLLKSMT